MSNGYACTYTYIYIHTPNKGDLVVITLCGARGKGLATVNRFFFFKLI